MMRYVFLMMLLVPACLAADSFEVEVSGKGDRAMILIPGLACSGSVWRDTATFFGDRFEVHTLTLAGFAGTAPIEGPFLDRVRDDLIDYIQDKQLDRPVIMGHSLGAFMSFYVASTRPDLVGPVVAVDGVPFISGLFRESATEESARPQAEMMRHMMAGLNAEAYATQTRMSMRLMITDDATFERVLAECVKSHPGTVGKAVYEMMTTDLRDDVSAIQTPVLLMAATTGMPEAMAEKTVARYRGQIATIEGSRLVVAENARHFIMLDDPGFFQKAVSSFLSEGSSAGGGL